LQVAFVRMIRRLSLRFFASATKAAPVSIQVPFFFSPVNSSQIIFDLHFLLLFRAHPSIFQRSLCVQGSFQAPATASSFPSREDKASTGLVSCSVFTLCLKAASHSIHVFLRFRLVTQLIRMPGRISLQTTIAFSSTKTRRQFSSISFARINSIS